MGGGVRVVGGGNSAAVAKRRAEQRRKKGRVEWAGPRGGGNREARGRVVILPDPNASDPSWTVVLA